jgi:hypothetical protein
VVRCLDSGSDCGARLRWIPRLETAKQGQNDAAGYDWYLTIDDGIEIWPEMEIVK